MGYRINKQGIKEMGIQIKPLISEGQIKKGDLILVETMSGKVETSFVSHVNVHDGKEHIQFGFNNDYVNDIVDGKTNHKNISIVINGGIFYE